LGITGADACGLLHEKKISEDKAVTAIILKWLTSLLLIG